MHPTSVGDCLVEVVGQELRMKCQYTPWIVGSISIFTDGLGSSCAGERALDQLVSDIASSFLPAAFPCAGWF